ncbi:glycosyl hydrolase family 95 catalytic domain-containing protein [Pedobacter frigoris]|uniref:glycosyl hydrolase family 95 catalytic domain-containing protein n=1 Tax=Pedobacter frigoris TaxID=2571272 RepID=UPI0029314D40|nr:glycoside hydrolase N-terminal domain-containing protein [Pedobacter frigoris]
MKRLLYFIFLTILLVVDFKGFAQQNRLWFKQPAANWYEALPIGNGRLGAMVFGNPGHEVLQLNEESVWAGSKVNANNPKALEYLPVIQKAIFENRFKTADSLSRLYMVGTPARIRSYQPLGNLELDFQWAGKPENYSRSLDIQTGITTAEYTINGNPVRQQVLVSAPDNCIFYRIEGSKKALINTSISLIRQKDVKVTAFPDGHIEMEGQIMDEINDKGGTRGPAGAHMKFAAEARVKLQRGTFEVKGNNLLIHDAESVEIVLTGATNYSLAKLDFDGSISPIASCKAILNKVKNTKSPDIIKRHVTEHKAMFDRVSLNFGADSLAKYPTDVRLNRVKEGKIDNGLIALYFQFGRYLLMGSSRKPAVLPANLQGIWNKDLEAPWSSDFHTNINLQMNYWPAEICNLPETAEVLANFMQQVAIPGAATAKETYGTKGWTMHHLTDVFGRTSICDGTWGMTPTNGAWITFPVYEHYLFTGDKAYLRDIAYPLLKGTCEFLLGFLVTSPEGYLVTNPSTSPENKFRLPNSKETSTLTYAATIDIQTVNAAFDYCAEAAAVLGTDADFIAKIRAAQKKLPPVKISSTGGIQEWIKDYEETEIGHRHMSHLLGLYPLSQINPETPEFFEAAKKTITRRLSQKGGGTGWSRAWIINFYARLLDGDKAYESINLLLSKSTLNNLFDTHPPFQIDGNFGGTAGIAEMLLQSTNGTIRLLPALPKAIPDGQVKGLIARGGFEVAMNWENGELTGATILSKLDNPLKISYKGKTVDFKTKKGVKYNLSKDLTLVKK